MGARPARGLVGKRIENDRSNAMKKQMKGPAKVAKVMREYKSGTLHSGKGGPVVKKRGQAIAIALSEAGMAKKGRRK